MTLKDISYINLKAGFIATLNEKSYLKLLEYISSKKLGAPYNI